MTFTGFIRECFASIKSAKVATALVTLVAFGISAVTIATVGSNIASQEKLESDLARVQARTLVVRDGGQATITPALVDILASLSSASATVALTNPTDVFSGVLGAGGPRVPMSGVYGDVVASVTLTSGRMPNPGEVIAGADALEELRISTPTGYVQDATGRQWSIVGSFEPKEPFERLSEYMLTEGRSAAFGQMSVIAPDLASVREVEAITLGALGDRLGPDVVVESAAQQAAKSRELIESISSSGRGQLAMVQGSGALFMFIVILTDVLLHARDLGRRRTLGVSRGGLLAFVTTRTALISFVGSVIGTASMWIYLAAIGTRVPTDFALATVVITAITASLAALIPATIATHRDPVRVMRTP